jgi:hypothetical protein
MCADVESTSSIECLAVSLIQFLRLMEVQVLSLSTAMVPSWSLSIRANEDDDISMGVELSSVG